MVTVTVIKPFRDLVRRCDRIAGETFKATEARAAQIQSGLPGYVSVSPEPDSKAKADLTGMTVAQLRALAAEQGVSIPRAAKKTQIIELLKE